MTTKGWIAVIVILAILIAALGWLDYTTPSSEPSDAAQTSTSTSTHENGSASSSAPLDTQVIVAKPAASSTVSSSFEVTGRAPNAWYYEAVFPIQVRDASDDLIASALGKAQSDWTVPGPVAFTSQIKLSTPYHGTATLILLKDNPSGDPENSDEVTVPIVIQ